MRKSPQRRSAKSNRRRLFGVSRRQKKNLQLSFEPLEDRRVMSAESPLNSDYQAPIFYSSDTVEGQQYILLRELSRYATQSSGNHSEVNTNSLPSDPFLEDQWHLINVGQEVGLSTANIQDIFGVPGEDINVAPVWNQGIFGEGIIVAVLDSGTELTHPDLDANIDPAFQLDALTGDSNAGPDLIDIFPINAHGTSVAGLIGAEANGEGGVGVAPGVQLVPIRLIDAGQTEQAFVDAFRFGGGAIDITNNSWGPGGARFVSGPTFREHQALRDSAVGGRDGLGTIHVFSAGNDAGFGNFGSAGYNGWVNSRYTIAVTGIDHDGAYNNIDGTVTDYPEAGASVLVAAPTGSFFQGIGNDSGNGSGLFTTDTTSDTGFNQDPEDNGEDLDFDSVANEAYTSRFNGTSAAAPLVSGVVALMLEANPNLSWRDVQEILVRSSRQNAKFDTQGDGLDKAAGLEYQSTWITNQVPMFHEPDLYDPLIPNSFQFFTPILDPRLSIIGQNSHYAPTPQVLTNGAGYTVSQGRGTNNDQIGYAHGVVDAELAVSLAQQWTTKGQNLPSELTFTTTPNTVIPVGGITNQIPAAHVVDPGGIEMLIPGGLGGGGPWQDYYDEYFEDVPDFTPFTNFSRGAPLELSVPQINGQDIVVENVEVLLDIGGTTNAASEALDHLRITLVSPNGTHSELNHYFVDPSYGPTVTHQSSGSFSVNPNTGEGIFALQPNGLNAVGDEDLDRLNPTPPTPGNLTFGFSTNRIWGERSDDAIFFDPTTNEPFVTAPGAGGNIFGGNGTFGDPTTLGEVVSRGWQLHFENYGTSDLTLNSVEIVWHGRPIAANTQRLQGLIGIDDNRDDLFNFSRVDQNVINYVGDDPSLLRLGEVQNFIDDTHESMAADITVLAFKDTNANGEIDPTDLLVDQFVTGADGNYFFDLVPDNYVIAIDDDSLGELAPLDDSLTPAGFVPDYLAQWAITTDYFKVWDYDANLNVQIDPTTNAPESFLDGNGNTIDYHVSNVNFLLDPGAPTAPEVIFTGQIIADVNGDGAFNGVDTAAPGIRVFGDVNRNNQFDAGEVVTSTDIDGNYTLVVPSTAIANINVGVLPPVDWSFTDPASGFLQFFTEPGDTLSGVDFALQPSTGLGTPGSAQPGTIIGFVFADDNEDGIRQTSEVGVPNIEVYIDNNGSGANDAGDTVVTTNDNGAYIFSSVPVGTHQIRVDISGNPTLEQTVPVLGLPNTVTITGENTVTGVRFGLNNTANFDYGDLPEVYNTLFDAGVHNNLTGGARHTKGIFFLGSSVDAELNGAPSADALGDDILGLNDEDGVFVDPLVAGSPGQLEVIASLNGGFLQAWMDFNGDGDFDDVIGGVSERLFTNELLDAGSNFLSFAVPDVIDADTVYARFRYGEFGLGLTGLASFGEVEDYVIPKQVVAPVHGPDFNGDGDVDGGDFLALQRGFGLLTNALPGNGDANNDGAVGMDDFQMWQQGFTGGTAALAAGQSGGSDDDSSAPPLAAAIAPSVDDNGLSESAFEAYYSSDHTSVNTLGPRLVQPGFPEELPNTVVDTESASSSLTRNQLAAVTGRVGVRSAYATAEDASAANEQEAPPEFAATRFDQAFEADEYAFAQRQVRLERLATRDFAETEEVEALALALDEDIDWLQL